MYEECTTESPTKKRSYAMWLLSGWMPQLNNVAIFGCFVHVGIRRGRIFDACAICFGLKTNYIFCCQTFYQLRSLL